MIQKEFILQGLTSRTHADAIREIFELPRIDRVILSVAFVTEGGVDLIREALSKHTSKATVLAGIRNELTSAQGLVALHGIVDELYTVDTGSRRIIFHPKLYLARSACRARLVVGSANLTLGGLNNNIEASMLLDFDLIDVADKAVIDTIEAQLIGLPTQHPGNVIRITKVAQIDALLYNGLIVDEMDVPAPRPSTAARSSNGDATSRINLKVTPIRKPLVKPKAASRPVAKPAVRAALTAATASVPAPTTTGIEFDLMWESKPLTRRDLTIPTASGTHATGSINLDKGLLNEDVDHRHYFRDSVFDHLAWSTSKSGRVVEANAKFQLVLKAVSYGEFDLRVGHTTTTMTASYVQRNAMTRLSWGAMRPLIARPDLIGRTLALYRDRADPTRFLIEID